MHEDVSDGLGGAVTLGPGERSAADQSRTTYARPLARGAVIGRYVVLARLGEGGMGEVYAAYDPELDRKVALKLLHDASAPGEAASGGRALLLREAQATAKLSHPNVVAVHDVGTIDDRVFVALEFVDGTTLRAWRKREKRTWREVLSVMQLAGAGLAAAHGVGLLHRDFKPDNVMIDRDDRVRVLDFGLARSLSDHRPSASEARPHEPAFADLATTREGAIVGTPAYMAPEQIARGPVDARTDVFAFAVSLWEMLHGARPFVGDTLPELASNVLGGRIAPPPKDAEVPAWLRRVVLRGLALSPDDRWSSMDAFLLSLSRDPTRHRSRTIALALLAGVPIVALGWSALATRHREAACLEAGSSVRALWDDDARRAVRTAMLATDLPYADTTYQKTVPWLDEYVDGLATMRAETCHSAEIEGTLTTEHHALIDACLDDLQADLVKTIDALRAADAQLLEDSVLTVSTLTRLEPCKDERRLAARTRAHAGASDAASQAEEMLRGAAALEQRGRKAEALALDRAALELAREEANVALEATAQLRIANLADRAGDFAEAERAAMAAFFVAGSAGIDETAAEAANLLVLVVGAHLGRAAEGLVWAEHARMVHKRVGVGENGPREIDLADHVAGLHRVAGDYVAARDQHLHALDLVESTYGPEHPRSAMLLNNLGLDHTALGEIDTALATFARARGLVERAMGQDHPFYATVLTNIAGAHFAHGDYDVALAEHHRALEIFEANLGPDDPQLAASFNGIGTIYIARGELDRARSWLERTLAVVERTRPANHPDVAAVSTNLGSVYDGLKRHDRALSFHARALEIWEATFGPEHPDVALALNNLGTSHFALHDLEAAEREHQRALEIREKNFGADHAELVSSLLGVGLVDLERGRPESGIAHLERALAICERREITGADAAHVRAYLGRALWKHGGDRVRARELVTSARAEQRRVGDSAALEQLDAWLAAPDAE